MAKYIWKITLMSSMEEVKSLPGLHNFQPILQQ